MDEAGEGEGAEGKVYDTLEVFFLGKTGAELIPYLLERVPNADS